MTTGSPPLNALDTLERMLEKALDRPGFEVAGDPAYASGNRDGLHFALSQIAQVRKMQDAEMECYRANDGPGVAWSPES